MKQKPVKPNTCSRFLFPLLKIPKELFMTVRYNYGQPFYSTRYINSYFADKEVPHFKIGDGFIFILCSNEQDKDFVAFEDTLRSQRGYVDEYDICKGKYGVKVFKLAEIFKPDYQLILEGKFSKISNDAKVLILENKIVHDNIALQIMSKDIELKKEWEEAIGEDIPPGLDYWPVIFDPNQYIKETISSELKAYLHVESMVPEESFN